MAESSLSTSDKPNPSNSDKIFLKLIRVNGQTRTFHFTPLTSASDIAKHVFENWPEDWTEDTVDTPAVLRLIYQGRFLHENATLGGLKVPVGKTTGMHLVSRETLPKPNPEDQTTKEKSHQSRCRRCCCIL